MEIRDFAYKRHLAGLASLPGHQPAADPTKLTAIQLIDKLVQIEDNVRTIYVCNDKPTDAKFRTKSLVLIFPLVVTLLYIPVLLKLLLLRRIEAYASQGRSWYSRSLCALRGSVACYVASTVGWCSI